MAVSARGKIVSESTVRELRGRSVNQPGVRGKHPRALRHVGTFLLTALTLAGIALPIGRAGAVGAGAPPEIVVGSKRFTESYVLGEIVAQTLRSHGVAASHRQGLGNTGILEQALASGAVDVYPEYTGTIVRELLKREGNPSLDELNTWLAPRGLKAAVPLGFNNTYALAMTETRARALGITRISEVLSARAEPLHSGSRTSFCSAPTAGRRCFGLMVPQSLRRRGSTMAWPTTPSWPAGST